jgi:hypothetical protein
MTGYRIMPLKGMPNAGSCNRHKIIIRYIGDLYG